MSETKRNFNENSEKYQVALSGLAAHLRPVFTQMVDEYAFSTLKRFGRGYVAYEVLADMVRSGWRPSDK